MTKKKGLGSIASSYPDGDLDKFEDLDNCSNYNDSNESENAAEFLQAHMYHAICPPQKSNLMWLAWAAVAITGH